MGRLILDRVDFYFNLDRDRMGGFDAKFNLAIDSVKNMIYGLRWEIEGAGIAPLRDLWGLLCC
jgi:hypothetical protein